MASVSFVGSLVIASIILVLALYLLSNLENMIIQIKGFLGFQKAITEFEDKLLFAVECARLRCIDPIGARAISYVSEDEFIRCKDFMPEEWLLEDRSLCGWNSLQFPVEVELKDKDLNIYFREDFRGIKCILIDKAKLGYKKPEEIKSIHLWFSDDLIIGSEKECPISETSTIKAYDDIELIKPTRIFLSGLTPLILIEHTYKYSEMIDLIVNSSPFYFNIEDEEEKIVEKYFLKEIYDEAETIENPKYRLKIKDSIFPDNDYYVKIRDGIWEFGKLGKKSIKIAPYVSIEPKSRYIIDGYWLNSEKAFDGRWIIKRIKDKDNFEIFAGGRYVCVKSREKIDGLRPNEWMAKIDGTRVAPSECNVGKSCNQQCIEKGFNWGEIVNGTLKEEKAYCMCGSSFYTKPIVCELKRKESKEFGKIYANGCDEPAYAIDQVDEFPWQQDIVEVDVISMGNWIRFDPNPYAFWGFTHHDKNLYREVSSVQLEKENKARTYLFESFGGYTKAIEGCDPTISADPCFSENSDGQRAPLGILRNDFVNKNGISVGEDFNKAWCGTYNGKIRECLLNNLNDTRDSKTYWYVCDNKYAYTSEKMYLDIPNATNQEIENDVEFKTGIINVKVGEIVRINASIIATNNYYICTEEGWKEHDIETVVSLFRNDKKLEIVSNLYNIKALDWPNNPRDYSSVIIYGKKPYAKIYSRVEKKDYYITLTEKSNSIGKNGRNSEIDFIELKPLVEENVKCAIQLYTGRNFRGRMELYTEDDLKETKIIKKNFNSAKVGIIDENGNFKESDKCKAILYEGEFQNVKYFSITLSSTTLFLNEIKSITLPYSFFIPR